MYSRSGLCRQFNTQQTQKQLDKIVRKNVKKKVCELETLADVVITQDDTPICAQICQLANILESTAVFTVELI